MSTIVPSEVRSFLAPDIAERVPFSDSLLNRVVQNIFQIASYLTDPVCKIREYYWRLAIVDSLNPIAYKLSNRIRKLALCIGIFGWVSLAVVTFVPGLGLRTLGIFLQKESFIHLQESKEAQKLPPNRSFSLLSWNVCCVEAGYSISNGGVLPWSFRIDKIIEKIFEKNADVTCLYEVFDPKTAFYISSRLKQYGYGHFYFHMNPKAIGLPSGIFVASKYKTHNPEFFPFPQDSLVGTTKYASKGVFSCTLKSQGEDFARILCTHLQHSEIPQKPTCEEIEARQKQMKIVVDRIDRCRVHCIVVTGDLNLENKEYNKSSWQALFQKGDRFANELKTWDGDTFCAQLVGQQVSAPLNLDHTMILKDTAKTIETNLVETGYEAAIFKEDALSDHKGLFSIITL